MSAVTETIEIHAAPTTVFDAVTKLENMGQFSPENTGGQWIKGADRAALGARFKGTNRSGEQTWNTTATVVEFTAPHNFAFEVTFGPVKVARWTYLIEETANGSRVTESWVDRRNGVVRRMARTPVTDRDSFTRDSLHETLTKLKAFLETAS